MAPPPNTTSGTAITIGTIPFTATVNAHDAGITYSLWYKYTAIAGDTMIGAFGWGGTPNAGYQPACQIYGPDSSTTQMVSGSANNAIQFPVIVGSVYYIKFLPNSTSISPASISIDIQRFTGSSYAIGDLLVPDEEVGFPASVLAKASGVPLKYLLQIPACEAGSVLDNGTMLLEDKDDGISKIFNSDCTLRIAVPALASTTGFTDNTSDTFYSVHSPLSVTPSTIWKITDTGIVTLVATLPNPPSLIVTSGISVSPDETILYYKWSNGGIIKRHNLLTDSSLSDLVGVLASYFPSARETLCLKDGTIIVAYYGLTAGDYLIKRYNPDGTVANTYTAPGSLNINSTIRLAHAIDNPSSFWVWYEQVSGGARTGLSFFLNIRVSDGSLLTNISGTQFSSGDYDGPQTATPVRFGHSESCPFLVIRAASAAPPLLADASGIYFINVTKSGRHDTYVDRSTTPVSTINKKIPDPTIRTALIGE